MAPDPRIGTQVADYLIERTVGRGGMSTVYLATDVTLGRKVALKILPPDLSEDPAFRERFIRESRLAASIDHPNIVPVYEAGEEDGVLYIAMRYVEGTDLWARIRDLGFLEPQAAVSVITQAAAALDAAHARGLVHRDVKPGNILLAPGIGADRRDHVYLADFGLTRHALSASGVTLSGQFVGTVDYCAPEQIKGEPIDGRADVYSLGAVLFECLTGRAPYQSNSEAAVLWGHIQGRPPSVNDYRSELPVEIDDVVARALAKSPDDRYATCSGLAADARGALQVDAGGPVAVRVRGSRRRRRSLLLSIVASLALIAATVVFIPRGGPPEFPHGSPNSIAVINASTDDLLDGRWVGREPGPIAYDPRSGVWLLNTGDGTVGRVDIKGMIVRPPIGIGHPLTAIAAGLGMVWVAARSRDTITVIDPRTNRPSKVIDVDTPSGIAVDDGSVWASSSGAAALYRIDPNTLSIVHTVSLGSNPKGAGAVATGLGRVWVAARGSASIDEIDPSNDRRTRISLSCRPTRLAVGAGFVWASCEADSLVERIDPVTGMVRPIPVGAGPLGMAVTSDGVWVACSQSGQVSKIDPATAVVVDRIPLHGSPRDLVAVLGKIWVTVAD